MTGMPAALALPSTSAIASPLARVTSRPSTFWSMAAWTSWTWFWVCASLEYRKVMLSLAAACSAPLRTVSQKASPAPAWVTMATFQRGVVTAPPAAAEALARASSARLPPVLLQPATATVRARTASAAATGRSRRTGLMRVVLIPIVSLPGGRAFAPPRPAGRSVRTVSCPAGGFLGVRWTPGPGRACQGGRLGRTRKGSFTET